MMPIIPGVSFFSWHFWNNISMVYVGNIHLLTIENWCNQVDVGRVSQSGTSYEIIRASDKSNAFILFGRLDVWFVTTLRVYCNNRYSLNSPYMWQHLSTKPCILEGVAIISMKGVNRLHLLWNVFTIRIRICIRGGMWTFIHVKCLQIQGMHIYNTEMVKSFDNVCPILVHMYSTFKRGGWRAGWLEWHCVIC